MFFQAGKLQKFTFLFFVGGFIYCIMEIIFRGYSHISMLIAGGICFVLIGGLNDLFKRDISLLSQMLVSVVIITSVELITGLIVNVWMHLDVWDYSYQRYNFMGQICLLFCNMWFILSFPAIILDDYIKYWFMGGKKPHYRFL